MSKQWRSSPFVVVVALALGLSAWAQQATGASVTPSVRPPRPTELDSYVKNFQFVELAQAMASMSLSAERDYFEGVLANREGHVAESVALLEKAIPQIRASNPMRTALALHALADNYVKSFRNNRRDSHLQRPAG